MGIFFYGSKLTPHSPKCRRMKPYLMKNEPPNGQGCVFVRGDFFSPNVFFKKNNLASLCDFISTADATVEQRWKVQSDYCWCDIF